MPFYVTFIQSSLWGGCLRLWYKILHANQESIDSEILPLDKLQQKYVIKLDIVCLYVCMLVRHTKHKWQDLKIAFIQTRGKQLIHGKNEHKTHQCGKMTRWIFAKTVMVSVTARTTASWIWLLLNYTRENRNMRRYYLLFVHFYWYESSWFCSSCELFSVFNTLKFT